MNEKEKIAQEIRNLQSDLRSTDYMVIKCYEASLVGEEQPYNMSEIHEERQKIRDRINALQKELDA